ncbi:unnamed protein product [Amoebophrya sp. A25]|nr:unnamed protein product [Amoebophrya sp. A25]|eukprot:GSA25T00010692001.1
MDCGGEVGKTPNEPTSLGSANLEAVDPPLGKPKPKDPEEFFDLQTLELTPEEQTLCLQRYDKAANERDRESRRFWIPWRAFVQLGGEHVRTKLDVRDYKLPDLDLVMTERALEPIPIGPDFKEYHQKADADASPIVAAVAKDADSLVSTSPTRMSDAGSQQTVAKAGSGPSAGSDTGLLDRPSLEAPTPGAGGSASPGGSLHVVPAPAPADAVQPVPDGATSGSKVPQAGAARLRSSSGSGVPSGPRNVENARREPRPAPTALPGGASPAPETPATANLFGGADASARTAAQSAATQTANVDATVQIQARQAPRPSAPATTSNGPTRAVVETSSNLNLFHNRDVVQKQAAAPSSTPQVFSPENAGLGPSAYTSADLEPSASTNAVLVGLKPSTRAGLEPPAPTALAGDEASPSATATSTATSTHVLNDETQEQVASTERVGAVGEVPSPDHEEASASGGNGNAMASRDGPQPDMALSRTAETRTTDGAGATRKENGGVTSPLTYAAPPVTPRSSAPLDDAAAPGTPRQAAAAENIAPPRLGSSAALSSTGGAATPGADLHADEMASKNDEKVLTQRQEQEQAASGADAAKESSKTTGDDADLHAVAVAIPDQGGASEGEAPALARPTVLDKKKNRRKRDVAGSEEQDKEEQAAYMEITVVGVLILMVIAVVIPIAFAVWVCFLLSSCPSSSSTPAAADNGEEDFLIPQQEETVTANAAYFLGAAAAADVDNIASSSVHHDGAGGTAVVDASAGGALSGSTDGRAGNAGGVVGPSAY